jgi:hypothetical protein
MKRSKEDVGWYEARFRWYGHVIKRDRCREDERHYEVRGN